MKTPSPMLPFVSLLMIIIWASSLSPSTGFVNVHNENNDDNNGNTANDENVVLAEEDEYDDDFFPPIADSDDISYFFSTYDLEGLHWALSNIFARSPRNPHISNSNNPHINNSNNNNNSNNIKNNKLKKELSPILVSRGGGDTYTTEYKLLHDLEQARYLVHQLQHSNPPISQYFQTTVIPIYEQVLKNIPPLEELSSKTKGLYAFTSLDYQLGIGSVYNKALYIETADQVDDEWRTRNEGSLLNTNELDFERIQNEWFGQVNDNDNVNDNSGNEGGETTNNNTRNTNNSIPGVLIVDNILTPQTLHILRQLLLRNTHWYQTKTPLEFGKYVGSYIDDGLHDPIFLELAKQLHQSLPRIMKGHDLKYMWAYKYDSEWESGIRLHADQAAVNVNMWLSLDDADLQEEGYGGGLVVFTAKPPENWDFESYNTNTEIVIDQLLKPTNFANVTIAHKPNRAVIFDSALFHQTDKYRFKKGYENGRINLTLLFGEMKKGDSLSVNDDGGVKNDEL